MGKKEFSYPSEALVKLEEKYSFASDDIYYYNTHRSAELVRKLQNRTQEFDARIVPHIFEKALHEKIITYEVSQAFGTGHIIVFVKTASGKDLVLRATHALPSPELYIDMEKEVIERYASVGIPSTTIITSDASRTQFPFEYQIMLQLSGKDLEDEWNGTKEEYDRISFELGQIIAKQYQIPGEGWGRWRRNASGTIVGAKAIHQDYLTAYVDHDLEVLGLFNMLTAQGVETLYTFFHSTSMKDLFSDIQTSYFVHHDIADHNIRYLKDKVVALYDWENAVLYDPISDLGSSPTWKVHYPREQKLIEGFIAELGTKPINFEAKIAVYLLRTMLWKIQFALKGKRLSSRHISLFTEALFRNGLSVTVSADQVK